VADGNLIETLKRIIRKQTTKIGSVVTNIHQGVASESPPLTAGAKQEWLWSRVPGGWLMSLQEFFAAYSADGEYKTEVVEGVEGAAVVASQTAQVHFLRGTVKTAVARNIDMAVSTASGRGEWAVYVDETLQRKGVDSGRFTLAIDQGTHAIEIIAFSEQLGVLVPRDLQIFALLENLRKPQWKSVTTGYVDAFMANPADILEWYTDPRCGGWRVMRRETEILGPITDASGVGIKGQIGIVIAGDYAADLEVGEELTAGTEDMGTVLNFTFAEDLVDPAGDGETLVRLRLAPSVAGPNPDWIGRPVGSGKWNELQRVRRSAVTGTVTYRDAAVAVGTIYEYKLQSFGLADETQVSPWSDIEYTRAGDVDPPGNIEFLDGYPQLTEPRRVTAKFLTPDDADYAGVRVYYRDTAFSGLVLSATSGSVIPDGAPLFTPNAYVGYTLLLASGGTLTDDLYQIVASNSTTEFFTSGELFQVPSGGDTLVVFYDRPILTDYGSPDQEDQLSFEPVFVGTRLGSGDYHFRTFDFTGNEQLFSGVTWNAASAGPTPIFGDLLGESMLFQGFDPKFPDVPVGGCVWLPVTLDRNTAEIWVFAEQSSTTPVPVSELSNNTQAWTLKRLEGDLPNVDNWSTMLYIATKTDYYQRVYAFGVGVNGQRGKTHTAEVQATDTHSPVLPAVEDLTLSRGINSVDLSWTVPLTTASTYEIETVVLRHGYPLAHIVHPSGTTYPYAQTLSDSGIASDIQYDYEVFTWSHGISGGLTEAESDPTQVGAIYMALHFVLPVVGENYWAVYFRDMPAPGNYAVLYWSFDGITFAQGPAGTTDTPLNDGTNDYGFFNHQETTDFRRYYKILVYDGPTSSDTVLGWTNTFLTDGSAGPTPPITITDARFVPDLFSPGDDGYQMTYDASSLNNPLAPTYKVWLYRSFSPTAATSSWTAINVPSPINYADPTMVDPLSTGGGRYYKIRLLDVNNAEVGWSNAVFVS
jgi:hypothetical protein